MEDLQARADEIITTATPYEPKHAEAPQDSKPDETPALADADKVFNGSDVDLSTMPAIRDIRRMLPSQRMSMFARINDIQKKVPKEMIAEDQGKIAEDLQQGESNLDAMTDVFADMEKFIFVMAVSRDEMEQWLLDQDDPMGALPAAFAHISEKVGKALQSTSV